MKSFFVFLAILPMTAFGAVQKLDASGGGVDFVATGRPSLLKIVGHGSPAEGNLNVDGDNVSGKLSFDLTSLGTDIEMRDHHMKNKYLEVDKFPTATLEIKKVGHLAAWDLKNPAVKEDTFEGLLTLHGVTKPVSGKFSISDKRAVEASFTVKLTDFGVAIPSFAGVTVADNVDVNVKIGNLTAAER